MKSLVIDTQHYIRNGDGVEELYDFSSDPFEQHDLADSQAGRRRLDGFRASLETLLARDGTTGRVAERFDGST